MSHVANHNQFSTLGFNTSFLLFVFAFFVRLLNIAFHNLTPEYLLVEDAMMYWSGSNDMLISRNFMQNNNGVWLPVTERVPFYYIYLATIRHFFDEGLIATVFIQAGMDSITCMFIGLIGSLYNRLAGILSGVMAAISPNMIIHSSSVLTDSLFLFFITVMLLALLKSFNRINLIWISVAGFTLGCAIMTRTIAQLLPFVILPFVFIFSIRHKLCKFKALMICTVFLFLCLLPLSPLIYRNIIYYDTFQLSSQTGIYVAGWLVPLVHQKYDGSLHEKSAHETLKKIELNFDPAKGLDDLNPFEKSDIYTKEGLKILFNYPITSIVSAWLEGMLINIASPALLVDQRVRSLSKLSYYNTPGSNVFIRAYKFLFNNTKSFTIIICVTLFFIPISIILKMYGFIIVYQKSYLIAIFMLTCVLYFIFINGPIASPKYRLPIEPIFIVLTAIGLTYFYEKWTLDSNATVH